MRRRIVLFAANLIVPILVSGQAQGEVISLAPIESGSYYHFFSPDSYARSTSQVTAGLNLYGTFSEDKAYFVFDLTGLGPIAGLAFSFYVVDPTRRENWNVELTAGAAGTEVTTLTGPDSGSQIAQVFESLGGSSYGNQSASQILPKCDLNLNDRGVADANLARLGPGRFALALTALSGGPGLRSVQVIDTVLRVSTAEVASLPEPSGWLLLTVGLVAAGLARGSQARSARKPRL